MQVYRGGKKVAEHIAAEGGLSALEKARLLELPVGRKGQACILLRARLHPVLIVK